MTEDILTVDPTLLDADDDLFLNFVKPQKKLKVVMLSDHPLSPSGVGVQARFLIEGLLKTGKYTFRCLGGAMRHQNYDVITVNPDFIIKPIDGFGNQNMIRDILAREKPDAIFIFTDPRQFIWLWEIEDEVRQVCPIVYWHVWDNDPYPAFNSPFYEGTDLINCISKKTYDLVQPNFPEKTHYIPHAFPKTVYRPLPETDVARLRKENFGDRSDWFFALWVNRNATRKMPGDLLVSWKNFLDELEKKHGHRNAALIMHTNPNDEAGPNLVAQSELLGLQGNVWFSAQAVDFEKMNILHNITDVCVNVSKNEGFGLSTLISLQVGKPVIVLSTGGETSKAYNHEGKPNGVALEPSTRALVGSQLVPYIYEDLTTHDAITNALLEVHAYTPEKKAELKAQLLEYVDLEFNFDNIVSKWDETLTKTVEDFQEKKEAQRGSWSVSLIETPVLRQPGPTPADLKRAEEAAIQAEIQKKMEELKSSMKVKKHTKKETK